MFKSPRSLWQHFAVAIVACFGHHVAELGQREQRKRPVDANKVRF